MADSHRSSDGVDPLTGFWRDVWARSAAAAGSTGPANPFAAMAGGTGMPPGADALGAAFTPDAVRRMQNAFLEAMGQYAEQWMKSPQFLEAMKRTMDRSLELRRQMDDFLQSNMASAFEAATGGANSEVMGAIRHATAQLQEQISRLAERLDALDPGKAAGRRGSRSRGGAKAGGRSGKRRDADREGSTSRRTRPST